MTTSPTSPELTISLQEELEAADPNYRKKKNIVVHDNTTVDLDEIFKDIVNSGEVESRNDGATPISNRQATSDDVTNFS